jgi:hypothetical protein
MTDEYVRAKIRDALTATDDDKHDAQKLLITWAVRDQALLLGMTKPHLKAVAAALIDHALRHKDEDDAGPDKFTRNEIDDIVASGAHAAREKRRASNVPPPKSTERQANAMRKLAAAFTRKKK